MLATVNPNLKVCGVPNPPPSLLEGLPELEVGVFPHPTMLPSSIVIAKQRLINFFMFNSSIFEFQIQIHIYIRIMDIESVLRS